MSRKTTSYWDYENHREIAGDDCFVFIFKVQPQICRSPLLLKGGEIKPGDTIHGMFGRKTAAGFTDFHPIAPGHLIYEGLYKTSEPELVLCSWPDRPDKAERPFLYHGWYYLTSCKELLNVRRNGSSCQVINSDFLFLNMNFPPLECLKSKHFWKSYTSDAAHSAVNS